MNTITLPLANVHCMNCVGKIRSALAQLPDCQIIDINTKQITLSSDSPLKAIYQKIKSLGYQVGFNYQLPLSGLSCGRCVAKVENAFSQRDDIFSYTVTKQQADVTGALSEQTLTDLISSLGYQVVSEPTAHTLTFSLSGLSCGRCVAKLTDKFNEAGNVEIIELDKTPTKLSTTHSASDVIAIITDAGYHASYTLTLLGSLKTVVPETVKENGEETEPALTGGKYAV